MQTMQTEVTTEGAAVQAPDRRRSRRQSFVANAWISAEAGTGGKNHHVVVNDLSLHGLGFSADSELESEAVHWMVLDAGGLRASARIRIASCRQRQNGTYECGAEFF